MAIIGWLALWNAQNLILATDLILLSALLSFLILLYIYTEIYILRCSIPGTDLSIFTCTPRPPPLNTSCMHTTEYKQVLTKNGTPSNRYRDRPTRRHPVGAETNSSSEFVEFSGQSAEYDLGVVAQGVIDNSRCESISITVVQFRRVMMLSTGSDRYHSVPSTMMISNWYHTKYSIWQPPIASQFSGPLYQTHIKTLSTFAWFVSSKKKRKRRKEWTWPPANVFGAVRKTPARLFGDLPPPSLFSPEIELDKFGNSLYLPLPFLFSYT